MKAIYRFPFTRPVVVALSFTLCGEFLIFILWGFFFFPAGNLIHKALWTVICGFGMGFVIGALVFFLVTGRLPDKRAAFASGLIFFSFIAFCTILCFRIDLATGGLFGADEAPALFLAGGLLPALPAATAYAWLLHGKTGKQLLIRIGL